MVERPSDDLLVSICLAIDPVVESVERASDWISPLVRLHLRIGPVRRKHRVERERYEQRNEYRARDCKRKWFEPLACNAVHECDRNEHGDDRERSGSNRETDLISAFMRRRHVILTHLDM